MKKYFLFKNLFLSILIVLIFSSNVFGFKAHRGEEGQYTLTELYQFIMLKDTSVYGVHMYINTKCIEFLKKRTGIELSEPAKRYFVLGAITADYDIFD